MYLEDMISMEFCVEVRIGMSRSQQWWEKMYFQHLSVPHGLSAGIIVLVPQSDCSSHLGMVFAVLTTNWWRFWGIVSNHRRWFLCGTKKWQRELRISDTCSGSLLIEQLVRCFRPENLRSRHVLSIIYITRLYHTWPFFGRKTPRQSMTWPRITPFGCGSSSGSVVVPVRRALASAEPQKMVGFLRRNGQGQKNRWLWVRNWTFWGGSTKKYS